jgi:DNA uptake protein ComE-like DNA-binding protein
VIQTSENQFPTLGSQAARLGPNHGYSIDGDVALLHAEVAVPNDPRSDRIPWALQLWACDAPHSGGPLFGVKVAEAPLRVVPDTPEPLRLDTEALATVPGGLRDYSMVLVLASGDQVHDFANYPERQRFVTPHLEGSVGYRLEGDQVVLKAERIRSPRRSDNLSGSLNLELWAVAERYRGGSVTGALLASVELGRLAGETSLDAVEQRARFNRPPTGEWHVVLMLREWAGAAGFVTRDYCNFAVPYGSPAAPKPVIAELRAKDHAERSVPRSSTQQLGAKSLAPGARPKAAEPQASAPVANAAAAAPAQTEPAAPAAAATHVSVLHASVEELSQVKGLNRKLAIEIIKARPFKTLDELVKVRGIGPKLLAALRAHLTL